MDEKSISLLFNILNALGSLATFLAFIFLFKKDKDKQAQIDRLTNIANVLEGQTEVMIKQNDLIAQQVDIFRNTSILKNQDDGAIKRLRDIEEQKLRLSVMPNLWLNGASTKAYEGELKVDLNNKGETAVFHEVNLLSGDILLHNNRTPFEIEKGGRRYIFAKAKEGKNINDCKYEIELKYKDSLSNDYISIIRGQGATVSRLETKEIKIQ
jgi:hypothetical protein